MKTRRNGELGSAARPSRKKTGRVAENSPQIVSTGKIFKTSISDDSDTGSETEVEEEEECGNLINTNVTEDFGTENDGTRFKTLLKTTF